MKKYMKLIRIKHWIKNLLIFLPVFCARAFNAENILNTIVAFFAFSFIASAIYIINDIRDVENDKKHPRKCKRPIASGDISIKNAIVTIIILIILSSYLNYLATGCILSTSLYVLAMYLIINIVYSLRCKKYSNSRCCNFGYWFCIKSVLWSFRFKNCCIQMAIFDST